jgi:hypothetical protein
VNGIRNAGNKSDILVIEFGIGRLCKAYISNVSQTVYRTTHSLPSQSWT